MSAMERAERGYAMAALLVGMSVMAVLMSALLPVWSHMAKREKEEELIFRGRQYARAIGLFQRKYANTAPPSIDVLVEQRFLRKKYKDPITNDDFQPMYANQMAQQQGPGSGSQVAQRPGESATSTIRTPAQQPRLQTGFNSTVTGAQGGVIGVTSKSKDASIKIYNGRNHYNEWAFVYIQTTQRAGETINLQNIPGRGGPGGPGGAGGPGGRGGPGGFPGPGGQPFQGPNSQPNRPPVMQPGQFPGGFPQNQFPQNPNGFSPPNGTTAIPVPPAQQRRPGGQ